MIELIVNEMGEETEQLEANLVHICSDVQA